MERVYDASMKPYLLTSHFVLPECRNEKNIQRIVHQTYNTCPIITFIISSLSIYYCILPSCMDLLFEVSNPPYQRARYSEIILQESRAVREAIKKSLAVV